jgi:uncharacterized protein (DUF433 family)
MWVFGQTYPTSTGRKMSRPIINIADTQPSRLSFVNMVEAHVLSAIRYRHGVSLSATRRAVQFLQQAFGSRHPLAEQQLQTDGVNLFVEHLRLLNVSDSGQYAMPDILHALLRRIERDEKGLAIRLYPFSRRPQLHAAGLEDAPRTIVIDPRVSFGRPVLAGTGVTTQSIAERFDAGESIDALAADYARPRQEIEEAVRCELVRDAA